MSLAAPKCAKVSLAAPRCAKVTLAAPRCAKVSLEAKRMYSTMGPDWLRLLEASLASVSTKVTTAPTTLATRKTPRTTDTVITVFVDTSPEPVSVDPLLPAAVGPVVLTV